MLFVPRASNEFSDLPDDVLECIARPLANADLVAWISSTPGFRRFARRNPHLFSARIFHPVRNFSPGELYLCNVSALKIKFSLFSKLRPPDAIDVVRRFRRLASLSIKINHRSKIVLDDLDLSCLGRLTTLRSLVLSSFCSSQLGFVSSLVDLEFLDISNGEWTDISSLRCLRRLDSLNINHCRRIVDFLPLASCTALSVLRARSTLITETHLLSALVRLVSVDLRETVVSETAGLSGLPRLQSVYISNRFGNVPPFFPSLGAALRHLSLRHCESIQCTPGAFRPLSALVYLDLSYCSLESLDFFCRGTLPLLETLRLDYNFLSDLAPLSFLPRLECLSLRGISVDDAAAFPLCRALVHLDLRESRVYSNFSAIGASKTLRTLNLAFARLDNQMLLSYLDAVRDFKAPIDRVEITGTFSSFNLPRFDSFPFENLNVLFENSSCFLIRFPQGH